tara:strand:+ start:108721 stop:109146 length:426 start_codon:yes stop_codon:yes gene_type:complete
LYLIELDYALVLNHILTISTAFIITLPIAWDRELDSVSAGLRTFPIVAIATCGFTLVGIEVLDTTGAEARVIQGIITGIGFIGGGAILKNSSSIAGTATAASLWNTGAIGIAVAFHRIEIALVLSAINFITLRYVKNFKQE